MQRFSRQRLTGTYFSEGVSVGDINGDGHPDVVHGPYWFAGPAFEKKREIYKPVPQPTEGYADNFFSWTHDFNGDNRVDVLTVGFPGTAAYIYENPGLQRQNSHWPKHEVFDWVSNESPQWTNLVGDDRPELVCSRDGFFGYATPDWRKPFESWTFHRVSDQVTDKRFGHALGVGDVDGDKRHDLLTKDGWYEQPATLGGLWKFHAFEFSKAGGADMFAYDVDGDGDNDVITSLDAHNYGLAWFEQIAVNDEISFRRHLIMGTKASDNKYGVLFTEPHSVRLVDIDGDGLKDICTGKTYYSHHKQSPMWDSGAVVYWFKLSRSEDEVDWIPYMADGQAGIGRQLVVEDVNKDGLPDFVSGGMKGCHVLLHQREQVDHATWLSEQPPLRKEMQAGLSPEEAARQMTLPSGFQVQLAAGEPLVHQPIAFAVDHRGRLWVAEAHNYPIRAPEGQGKDKIIILEDTDHDGTLESRKEFATGLNLVSGLELGFGGVWVGAAPYLMFIPDADGDDVPDGDPQILLDGFGFQDTHETLNAFIWGPDGWLYGCHGVFTHSKVGKPGTPVDQRVPMNGAVWRYHPTRHVFDVFSRGTSNPWGIDFDDHGQAFVTACVIPHLWHIIQGARYQRQGGQHFNPHIYGDIKTIADHSHYTGNIQDSAWWGHEPELTDAVSLAGGGHAHCGAMIYLADNWPAKYRNSIFFNNIHGNRVNNDILERHGSGYIGRHGRDFLLANDKWYRGINLKYGPDGSVHLIDWYDKNACHRANPEIWDRSNGRIYRIAYGNVEPKSVDLSKQTSIELAKLQKHSNEWYVRMARRILQERSVAGQPMEAVHRYLETLLSNESTTSTRLRALWALHATDGITSRILRLVVEDGDEYLRSWAIQLAVPEVVPSAIPSEVPNETVAMLERMADDDSPLVRLYVASALQRIASSQRWEIAKKLLSHSEDRDDHNIPLMSWYGIEPIVVDDVARAMELARSSKIPLVSRFIVRRAAAETDSLGEVLAAIDGRSPQWQHIVTDEILKAFEGRVGIAMPKSWNRVYSQLLDTDDARIREKADRIAVSLGDQRILPRMRSVLTNKDASLALRQQAMQVLLQARDTQAAPALLAALEDRTLRAPAIRALAAYDHPMTANALVTRYQVLSVSERRDTIATLTARPEYATVLLDAIEREQIPRNDVHAYNIRQLQSLKNEEITGRLEAVWGTIRETSADKRAKIASYKQWLVDDLKDADLAHGRMLFKKNCASCHRLFGDGGITGPDITGSNRANLDYILENVIDPSAVVSADYKMSTIVLQDGRVLTGLIERETDSAYTVRTVNDVMLIAKSDVEQRSRSELSLMPEGQLDQLDRLGVRDLIAYLGSPSQVSLPKTPIPIDAKTGKVPNAVEGESIAITSKSDGDTRSQVMTSFKGDRWSGNRQLWWTGQKIGSQLDMEVAVNQQGVYTIETALTRARDYGVVELFLDDTSLGTIDCFISDRVDSTGVLRFTHVALEKGKHRFTARIVGKNAESSGTMFGLDYVRVIE